MCEQANEVLGFRLTDVMFHGTTEELKQTDITQPAVFLHSVVANRVMTIDRPQMVAGHSLGEYSALVACGALRFEDALRLVHKRAVAMQKACKMQESTMAAVLGMQDDRVDQLCQQVSGDIVVAANFNCPGQVVISGTVTGIDKACELLKEHGAKRAIRLQVGGAFHSPLMQPAAEELRRDMVSQEQAVELCKQAGKHLCSIDEWQAACRGKDKTRYSYGDSYRQNKCNTNTKAMKRSGRKEQCRSWFGMYDMNGNLWEWTSSASKDHPNMFLVAGGAWNTNNESKCTDNKFSFYPQNQYPSVGFRCCN